MMFSSSLWGNISDKYGRKVVGLNPAHVNTDVHCLTKDLSQCCFNVVLHVSSVFNTLHAVDTLLWAAQCFCTCLWLDLSLASSCGIWPGRSPSVVSFSISSINKQSVICCFSAHTCATFIQDVTHNLWFGSSGCLKGLNSHQY